eukprot:CAMPEP_0184341578 /NCGR_PEP_ID=MMETSP1089-20130417/10174_1 /TAXON_ID=38269 ORGANISM="Gloeochaete wittrockiana, Strain SAG46.84" /NCGR_SAMPLE_ID=MMETSP1089 /ASSEMBLY_ACC=CAM_ASM_000445 /LENGTH=367 /DNA_ID=CAMNT_0026669937 /DNA_START=59 /DNA_END=1162 /DNA_ORIENTATION=-
MSAEKSVDPFERVKVSCFEAIRNGSRHVTVDEEKLRQFHEESVKNSTELASSVSWPSTPVPINFPSIADQVNFYALRALLSFGSGWDQAIRGYHHAKGASDAVLYALLGVALGDRSLASDLLINLSVHDVGSYFNLPPQVEAPLPDTPAIKTLVNSDVRDFLDLITKVLNTVGERLWARQYKSLDQFIRDSVKDAKSKGRDPAAVVVDDLIKLLPTVLDDSFHQQAVDPANAQQNAQQHSIFLYYKAQLLIAELSTNVGPHDPMYTFDLRHLSALSNTALASGLIAQGIIRLSEKMSEKLQKRKGVLWEGEETGALRAASVYVVERLVQMGVPEGLDALHVGAFLRRLFKTSVADRPSLSTKSVYFC